jgi:hypothetical protein
MFDQISDILKKKIAHKRSRRGLQQRESIRYRYINYYYIAAICPIQ